ncbi:SDR family oxidoreductase [Longitalea luteola]|uniref:SDR family oxidoreductase n=1 Tax=Longitalea luteola TaxID=2812563 RepID=UPI001A97D19F|nr:SDR family NAD(P)-dependent oxidoreductase [Longitalea luteola]
MKPESKILVTGGASGIGLGIVERLVRDNHTVIVCGRREDVLQDLSVKHPAVITRKCDLESAAEREALYKWVAAAHSDLNVLINNAGIQNWMSPLDGDFFLKAQQEIAINVEAPLHLTALFLQLPALDTIMNVTSGLAISPFAKVPVYSATKAFFRSFTHSLRYILKDRNINVVEIVPPALNTDLGGKGLHDHAPAVGPFIESIFQQLEQGKTELTYGTSTDRAKIGAEELQKEFAKLHP